MPSIMDLVREYSELEFKRNQRGGMLEPQSEIRYQALKFFLEFDLFPMPSHRPADVLRSYDRKKETSSEEISRPSEMNTLNETATYKAKENSVPDSKSESIETDLISVISETSLPINDTVESVSPVQKTAQEIFEPEASVSSNKSLNINPEEKIPEAEVVDIVEAVDEAVENVLLTDTSKSTAIEPENSPAITKDETSKNQESSVIDTIDQTDLSEHIDSAFDRVIQFEDVSDETKADSENRSPDIPVTMQETTSKSEPSSVVEPTIKEILPDMQDVAGSVPEDDTKGGISIQEEVALPSDINVEELLKPSIPASNGVAPDVMPPEINIEEIIMNVSSSDTSHQNAQREQNNGIADTPQIDFLSGLNIPSETDAKSVKPDLEVKKPMEISLDEVIPGEISVSIPNAGQGNLGQVFINTPVRSAVHMIDGDARRGIIKELTDEMTEIDLFEDESLQNSTKIPVTAIKAIFVIKNTGEHNIELRGLRINVRFKDDRSISGISPDYSEDKQVFALYPEDNTQSIRMIIVYREFVEEVEIL